MALCAVDGLAVDLQPRADLTQQRLLGCGIVPSAWADVEQQRAVLAHHVHQILDQRLRRLVILRLDITPGVLGDRRVVLPKQRADAAQPGGVDVEHRLALFLYASYL